MDLSQPIKGFLIAPLVPCIGWAIVVLNPTILVFAIPVSYMCALLLGAPLYLILRKLNKVNVLTILAGGTIAGGLPSLVFMALVTKSLSELFSPYHMKSLALFALFGLIAGVIFWLVTIKNQ